MDIDVNHLKVVLVGKNNIIKWLLRKQIYIFRSRIFPLQVFMVKEGV